jgi:hypothetical protein
MRFNAAAVSEAVGIRASSLRLECLPLLEVIDIPSFFLKLAPDRCGDCFTMVHHPPWDRPLLGILPLDSHDLNGAEPGRVVVELSKLYVCACVRGGAGSGGVVVWCGVVWCGVVWCGVVVEWWWYGVVW